MKASSSRACDLIATAGALLLLSGNLSAQDDPFRKEQAPTPPPAETEQPLIADTFQEIADRAKPAILGVAVYDFETGAMQGVNLSRPFSLQSVFKIFLSSALLSQVDAGQLSLDKTITLTPEDLRGGGGTIDHSDGGSFTVRDLLRAALIESDNSAADALLRLSGGPEKVTAWLRGKGIEGVRIDRDLRTIARDENGIPADLFPGRNASSIQDRVPKATRQAAFEFALSDPRDTGTPEGAVHFLVALKKGEILSASSTSLLLGWLQEVKTGQGRLRAGFSLQTTLAHKTGTSLSFEGVNLATNDIGLATLPGGRTLAIAVFLSGASGTDQERSRILAACARVAAKSN
ncbi:MAG: serine hydrolase [Akkermansiaceae bacterium]|nr:serine hydrolase [Akkermansiaceae bacterium]